MQSSVFKLNRHIIISISLILLLAPLFFGEYYILLYTKGIFSYSLDDPFIHMAIAKNIVLHNTWGVTKYEFASASSSILYPLVLAIFFKFFGVNIIAPFIINIIAAIILIILIQKRYHKLGIPPIFQLLGLTGIIFLTPLAYIISTGMEHTLQILFCYLIIFSFADWITHEIKNGNKKWKIPLPLYIYGMLVTSIRYEGIFIIITVCLILFFLGKIIPVIIYGFISVCPVLIYGFYSKLHGGFFLPNSVILKSDNLSLSANSLVTFFTRIPEKLYYPHAMMHDLLIQKTLIILPLLYFLFKNKIPDKTNIRYCIILITAITVTHLLFAKIDFSYRYESYLIVMCLVLVFCIIPYISFDFENFKINSSSIISIGLSVYLVIPFLERGFDSSSTIVPISKRYFNQNYSMAQFIHKYYDGVPIAVYDLGEVSYFNNNSYILDIGGLGNNEVAKSYHGGYYNYNFINNIVKEKDIKIAAVFDISIPSQIQSKWKKVATWHSLDFEIPHYDLQFYAVDSTYTANLLANLKNYEKVVPKNEIITYYE
ncbi:hypothetical protein [Chitinophaga sancti]|uniref:4-amino-4-deoxy-L-arabinose transferase n=1 Tax=Chitinophaga sancti TaxID=1004 RepID=A0A1K1T2Q6_9BACT|nr:hypothetical protein [Chitinophaga sancti]WQD59633.1 hypothetical protein U0033_17235 [Chitinophaga sancti]WQG88236.1 hypothetical protein SR876_25230 [Chitinophaga sancti]SFW90859.1 hypothetical protein SAMN05661012_06688 [Chitinophaga sancti]